MKQINIESTKFNDKYNQIIHYVNINDKFKSESLTVNYSPEQIDSLETIYQNIVHLIDQLNALK